MTYHDEWQHIWINGDIRIGKPGWVYKPWGKPDIFVGYESLPWLVADRVDMDDHWMEDDT